MPKADDTADTTDASDTSSTTPPATDTAPGQAALQQAVADAKDHADRAEAAAATAASAGSATGAAAPVGPYLAALVVVRTAEEIDGQHEHAAVVTRVGDGTINAAVLRAEDGIVTLHHLPFDDGSLVDGSDGWHWPQIPVAAG